jgi:ABC-type Fe3+/spermidine/putrescine transport system ATPase subunit
VTNFLEGQLISQSAEAALVEVPGLGQIRANSLAGAVSGQAVTLAVRPERMELRTVSEASSHNQVHGIIVEVVFVGNDTQYFVQLANGSRIMVRQQNKLPLADTLPIVPAQAVVVDWSAASTNVLIQ